MFILLEQNIEYHKFLNYIYLGVTKDIGTKPVLRGCLIWISRKFYKLFYDSAVNWYLHVTIMPRKMLYAPSYGIRLKRTIYFHWTGQSNYYYLTWQFALNFTLRYQLASLVNQFSWTKIPLLLILIVIDV